MHRVEHLFVLVWACDRQNLRVVFADVVGFGAQAACDDDLAVFLEGLADGIKDSALADRGSRRC